VKRAEGRRPRPPDRMKKATIFSLPQRFDRILAACRSSSRRRRLRPASRKHRCLLFSRASPDRCMGRRGSRTGWTSGDVPGRPPHGRWSLPGQIPGEASRPWFPDRAAAGIMGDQLKWGARPHSSSSATLRADGEVPLGDVQADRQNVQTMLRNAYFTATHPFPASARGSSRPTG